MVRAIDKGDTLGALSLANGYNTTINDLCVGNNFSRVTGGVTLDKAIANNQTINVFSDERLSTLKSAKKISYDSGKGLPDFFQTTHFPFRYYFSLCLLFTFPARMVR